MRSRLGFRRRGELVVVRAAVFGLAAACTLVTPHQIQDRVGFDNPLTALLIVSAGFGLGMLAARAAALLARG
jgi:hypothetical protein